MEGVGYPAGVAIADACAGGCVLGSERRLKRPEEHMPPRLGRKLPSIKISAEGRDQSSESYVLYSTARVICTAVAAVMGYACTVNVTYDMSYVQYLQQQLRERRIRMHVVYSRTCDTYSSSSI